MDLPRTQVFYVHKALEFIMIYNHKNFMFAAFYIMLLYLKKLNNSQKLIIMSFIPSFSQNYLSKKQNYQMPLAQII